MLSLHPRSCERRGPYPSGLAWPSTGLSSIALIKTPLQVGMHPLRSALSPWHAGAGSFKGPEAAIQRIYASVNNRARKEHHMDTDRP